MVQAYSTCKIKKPWDDSNPYHDLLIDPVKVPKCLKVVITEESDIITFDFGMLSKIVQPAKKGNYLDYISILRNVSHKEPALRIKFNAKMLSSVLASLAKDSKSVNMTFFSPLDGVMIDGDRSRGYVLPIRSCESDSFNDMYA